MPRRHSYVKRNGVYAAPASWLSSFGGVTRRSVLEAAEVFATQARANARAFSRRIPGATHVEPASEHAATVVTDGDSAPNAAPFEFGERHPLFGNTKRWYKQPTRSYMGKAANNLSVAEMALQVYGDSETALLAEEYGYTE